MSLTKPEKDYASLLQEAEKRRMTVQEYADSLDTAYKGRIRPEKERRSSPAAVVIVCVLAALLIAAIVFVIFRVVYKYPAPKNVPNPHPEAVTATPPSVPTDALTPQPTAPNDYLYVYPRPETGKTYFENNFQSRDSALKVSVDSERDYYILLEYTSTGEFGNLFGTKKFAFYVRSGDTATVAVPTGTAKLYYASGKEWYGFSDLFGDSTVYHTSDDVFDFSNYKYELTLYPVPDGDFETHEIDPEDFPG